MAGLSIAKSLELSLVAPTVTHDDVRSGCALATEAHLAAVTVFPVHVRLAAELLAGTDTRVVAAIGFPYGQDVVATKLRAIEVARSDGADELAVMLDHSALASADAEAARVELERVLSSAFWSSLVTTRGQGHLTIVVETMLLDLDMLAPLWPALHESAASFLQTSAGFQGRAITGDHIRRVRELLPADIQVKAVGGIATLEDAVGLINAGAVRIGSGSAIAIAGQEVRARATGQVQHDT